MEKVKNKKKMNNFFKVNKIKKFFTFKGSKNKKESTGHLSTEDESKEKEKCVNILSLFSDNLESTVRWQSTKIGEQNNPSNMAVEEKENGNDLPPEKGEECTLDKVEEEVEEVCTSNKVEEGKEKECISVRVEEEEDKGKDDAPSQAVRSSIFQNPPKLRLNDDLVADMYFGTSPSRLQNDLLDNPCMKPHPPNKFFLSRQIKK